ncbi:hypothetical protein [Acuticoccus sp. I52.16.1]|uniref:hypothetical protein n=1 Tax=Acuticoccus sp. I52.16.1 TaxID=2928472 RepID=UPI001FD04E7C|nr:hypothetical protein [Acuticoccus sp. I52.16.1]UOM35522.1 hypothetical protein MRB58_04750 [Acuticoccus sp. I52.16.1]
MFRQFGSVLSDYRRDLTLIDAAPSGERVERPDCAGTSLLSGAPIARIPPRADAPSSPLVNDSDAPLVGAPLHLRIQIVDAALSPLSGVPVTVGLRAPTPVDGIGRAVRTVAVTSDKGIAEIETVFPIPTAGRPQIAFQAALEHASVRGVIALPDEVGEFLAEHVPPYCGDATDTFALWRPAYLAQAVISADRSAAPGPPGRPAVPPRRYRAGRYLASRAFATLLAVTSAAAHLFSGSGTPTAKETVTALSPEQEPDGRRDA